MQRSKQTPRKSRRLALPFLSLIALVGAVSPVAAATGFANMDQAAIAMIIAFGTLLLSIVFEVWRSTLNTTKPATNRATHEWQQGENTKA